MQGPRLMAATKRVEFVDKMKFAPAAFDREDEMLRRYELLSGRACAYAEPRHLPHEFSDFINLLAPDFAAKPSKPFGTNNYPTNWLMVRQILDRSIV